MKPRIEIRYCPRCRWLLRAAWYAQELLSTFENDLGEVALVPAPAGVFTITLDGTVVMNRQAEGFLEVKVVKRRVRDHLAPGRGLGHIDGPPSADEALDPVLDPALDPVTADDDEGADASDEASDEAEATMDEPADPPEESPEETPG